MKTTIQEYALRGSKLATELHGLARRVLLKTLTSKMVAQIVGYTGAYGETEATDRVEVFQGIGIYCIPPATGKPEAIEIHIGAASGHPVIVAMRDKGTPLPTTAVPDESLLYNSVAFIKIDKDGNIEVRAKAGGTIKLGDGTALTALANGVVVASGIDPFTGSTYGVLGNASAQVMAKK